MDWYLSGCIAPVAAAHSPQTHVRLHICVGHSKLNAEQRNMCEREKNRVPCRRFVFSSRASHFLVSEGEGGSTRKFAKRWALIALW